MKNCHTSFFRCLLIIGILCIVALVSIIALRPSQRLRHEQDLSQQEKVTQIASAIAEYYKATGELPQDRDGERIDMAKKILGTSDGDCSLLSCPAIEDQGSACIDLASDLIVEGGYLQTMPISLPGTERVYDATHTGFYVFIDREKSGNIVVGSCEKSSYGDVILTKVPHS